MKLIISVSSFLTLSGQERNLGVPVVAFDQINEREEKIMGKKEIKTEYYSESKEITYFVIEDMKRNQ